MSARDFLANIKSLFSSSERAVTDQHGRVLALVGLINNADFAAFYRLEDEATVLVSGWNLPDHFEHHAQRNTTHAALFLKTDQHPYLQLANPASYVDFKDDPYLEKLDLRALWLLDCGSHDLGHGAIALYFKNTPHRLEAGLASMQQAAAILRFEEERLLFQKRSEPFVQKTESLIEGVSLADAQQENTPLIFTNEGFEVLTGYRSEEVVGKNCKFLQGPETSTQTKLRLSQAIKDKAPLRVEILNYRKDGQPFWNLLSIQPVFDARGTLTYFLGLQLDITKWRNHLMQSEARRASKNRVAQMQQGLAVIDKQGQLLSANEALANIFEYENAAAMKGLFLYQLIVDMDPMLMQQVLDDPEHASVPEEFLGPLGRTKEGSVFALHYSLQAVHGQDQSQFVGVFEDRRMQRTGTLDIGRSLEALERSHKVKDQLLNSMSHTIRTRLHAILSYVRFANKKLNPSDDQVKDFFTSISVSGEQLVGYINHLLELAKLEAEPRLYRASRHDISLTIDQLISQFDKHLLLRKINLDYHINVTDASVWIDSSSINQILFQVIDYLVTSCKQGDYLNIHLQRGTIQSKGSRIACLTVKLSRHNNRPPGTFDETGVLKESNDIGFTLSQAVVHRYGGDLKMYEREKDEYVILKLPMLPTL